MFAYGKNFGVDRVVLLYPDFGDGYEDELVLGKDAEALSLAIKVIDLICMRNQIDFLEELICI
jgi:hypothetical protein